MKKLVLAVICLFASVCSAQTAQPIWQPHQTFVDGSGSPCAGCKVYSYVAGTTTPLATFTDASEGSQNTNPIVLDAAGGANIWIGSSAYKFALLDTFGTTLWTVDNVLAPAPGGGGPYLPLAGGTLTGSVFGPLFSGTTIDGTTINGGTGNFSGVLTAQVQLSAQSNVVLGSEGTDNYLEVLPDVSGNSIFYVDNHANAFRISNGTPGSFPLTFDNSGNLTIPGIFTATTVNAALNGTLGATTPNTVAGTTGTFSGALSAAGITGTSVTDSGLTSGNCVQAGTGGLLTPGTGPCAIAPALTGTSGYQALSSGLILEWGVSTTFDTGPVSQTLPFTFPHGCLFASASDNIASSSRRIWAAACSSTTAITLKNDGNGQGNWFAIGY